MRFLSLLLSSHGLFGPTRHAHLLLDRKTLTTAYPELIVSGGKGSRIVLTYSEALYDKNEHKGDRDSIDYTDPNGTKHPRKALGLTDSFLPDGGSASRLHAPLVAHLALSRPRHHYRL